MERNLVIIKVFAELKDLIGRNQLKVNLEKDTNLVEFMESLLIEIPAFSSIIEQANLRYKFYLNGELLENISSSVIKASDELVIIPPVGGG